MDQLKLSVPLPDVLHESDGDIRIKGSRISLYHIVTAYEEQWISAHMMVFHYPTLSLREIQKVLAFYEANRAAVGEYIREYKACIDQQRAAGKTLDVEALRRRFQAMQAARTAEANGVHAPGVQPADTQRTGG